MGQVIALLLIGASAGAALATVLARKEIARLVTKLIQADASFSKESDRGCYLSLQVRRLEWRLVQAQDDVKWLKGRAERLEKERNNMWSWASDHCEVICEHCGETLLARQCLEYFWPTDVRPLPAAMCRDCGLKQQAEWEAKEKTEYTWHGVEFGDCDSCGGHPVAITSEAGHNFCEPCQSNAPGSPSV